MHANRSMSCLVFVALLSACGTAPVLDGSDLNETLQSDGAARSADAEPTEPSTDAMGPAADASALASHCRDDQVTLTMSVDDTANQTYDEGDLLWTGSFSFDASTDTVVYATAWQPADGPYPPLFDDGPVSAGGHEAEGQLSDDHIFSVAVCYTPEQDRLLSYGVLNADLRWIWQGPNGLLDVPIGATGQLDAAGLVIPAHGDRDIEVTLDLAALHPDYASISLETHAVFLKGSMNAWTPIQLLDNGTLGDDIAGDGRLTYRHSAYAHGHIGLLRPGQEAQFVFVFALGDLDPDLAAEYKIAGEAAVEGTSARMQCLDGWRDAEIIQTLDSKGVTLNTALMVCPEDPDEPLNLTPSPECDAQTPCPVGLTCEDETCVSASDEPCSDETPCPDGESCIDGDCITSETSPCESIECDDEEDCVDGACIPASAGECGPATPCAEPSAVCIDGVCSVPSSSPELLLILPATGSELGGTTVSLQGSGFDEGAVITFGDNAADMISYSPSELVVTSPAHALGPGDVTVTNPDGALSTYPGGFTFVAADSAPMITSIAPTSGPSSGGTQVTVLGANFAQGAIVRFGTATASQTDVASDGTSLSTASPEAPLGAVTLTVVNPDGQETSLPDAFTYSPNVPDWGQLHPPAFITALAEVETITLSAEVYEATVTEGDGPGFGISAEVGFGPIDTLPEEDNGWLWHPATFSGDVDNNDTWTGSFTAPEGSWAATMRFSLGASDTWLIVDRDGTDAGTQADQFTTLEITSAPPVAITSVSPQTSWLPGGAVISLDGVGLSESCALALNGVELTTSWEPPTLRFVAPPHAVGEAALLLNCPEGSAEAALSYVESWDGDLDEWPETSLIATNTLPSSWGEDNALRGLYVAADATHLYIAVDGQCDGGDGFNAIVVYIDTDFGSDTGVTQAAALNDTNHAVDAVLGGVLEFTAPGFGAEAAVATLNMTGYDPLFTDPMDATAGWRALAPSDDFPWLISGAVYTSPTSLEARIPLDALFATPAGQTQTLGFVVRITNATGDYTADQALPEGVSGEANGVAPFAAVFSLTY